MRGYNKLSDPLKKLFDRTHGIHQSALGTELKEVYSRKNVTRLIADPEQRCILVYFKNGEMFKYFTDHTWG